MYEIYLQIILDYTSHLSITGKAGFFSAVGMDERANTKSSDTRTPSCRTPLVICVPLVKALSIIITLRRCVTIHQL